jgi:[ribosomal protein S5]-alanine N-acetyltransferase
MFLKQLEKLISKYDSKTISLRLAQQNDAEFIYNMMQDKDYQKYYMDRLIPKSIESTKKEINNFLKSAKRGNGYYFLIRYKKTPVGILNVYKGHAQDKRAAIGYGLARKYWKKGITTKALKILLKIMKNEFDFHAVEATAYPKNIASRKVLKKSGFKEVGTMEKYTFSKGKWEDRVLYWKILN